MTQPIHPDTYLVLTIIVLSAVCYPLAVFVAIFGIICKLLAGRVTPPPQPLPEWVGNDKRLQEAVRYDPARFRNFRGGQ